MMDNDSTTHRRLCDSVTESARPFRPGLRSAVALLVGYDEGAWFHDEDFRRFMLVEEPEGEGVRVSSAALRDLAREGLDREEWVHDLGHAAFGVLWMAAHLAEGELGRLLDHADSRTAVLISSVVEEALGRKASGGSSQSRSGTVPRT